MPLTFRQYKKSFKIDGHSDRRQVFNNSYPLYLFFPPTHLFLFRALKKRFSQNFQTPLSKHDCVLWFSFDGYPTTDNINPGHRMANAGSLP